MIETRFQAEAQKRNFFITNAVPFLFRAVGRSHILDLTSHFYDCNRSLFNDSREQHLKEATAMLESVVKTYEGELNATERAIYRELHDKEQDAFRICRDLALLPQPDREPMSFFLSFEHLGHRLGIHAMQAQRIMRRLAAYGMVKILKKGTRRAEGVRGEATNYLWLLPATKERNNEHD